MQMCDSQLLQIKFFGELSYEIPGYYTLSRNENYCTLSRNETTIPYQEM